MFLGEDPEREGGGEGGVRRQRPSLDPPLEVEGTFAHLTIGDFSIPPTSSARNIGVIFDSTFQIDAQVGKVCQACYFWLRNIRWVKSHLTLTATASPEYKSNSPELHSLDASHREYPSFCPVHALL